MLPIMGVDILGFLSEFSQGLWLSISFADFIFKLSWKPFIKPIPQSRFSPWTANCQQVETNKVVGDMLGIFHLEIGKFVFYIGGLIKRTKVVLKFIYK